MKAPTLAELKSRPCTTEELQAALIQQIELYNHSMNALNEMIANGRIRSPQEALMNTAFGLPA